MTDRELAVGCKKGKPKYQRMLVDKFAPVLMTICRRYSTDVHAAEDVLQEAFIRVFKYIKGFDPEKGSLESWLRKLTVNTALQKMNKRYVWNETQEMEQMQSGQNPKVYSKLGAEEIMKLLERLPVGYRTVFNLFVVESYSHKEIAEALNIKEASSRSQLQRARTMLQEMVRFQEAYKYEPKEL